jgi:triacylglycerol esterase/lipase EstA (alpha/beta hydrolase family)
MVGHSQGGLMPNYYIKRLGGASKVHTFVALAPSNHGTDLNGLTQLLAGFRGLLNGTLVLLQEPALADVRNALAGGSASYRPTCSGFGPAI